MMRPPYKQIVEHYEYLTPKIMQRQSERIRGWIYPYCHIAWERYFSPIEDQAWMAIRAFGKVPMYPQYPAQSYFLDFANPYSKIAIECDGKEFHTDKEKDRIRDENLAKDHWIVYRISGADCYKIPDKYYDIDFEDEQEAYNILHEFYMQSIEGLLKAIAIFHFQYSYFNQDVKELDLAHKCLKLRASPTEYDFDKKYDQILRSYEFNDYDR